MKRLLSIILALIMLLCVFVSCGDEESSSTGANSESSKVEETSTNDETCVKDPPSTKENGNLNIVSHETQEMYPFLFCVDVDDDDKRGYDVGQKNAEAGYVIFDTYEELANYSPSYTMNEINMDMVDREMFEESSVMLIKRSFPAIYNSEYGFNNLSYIDGKPCISSHWILNEDFPQVYWEHDVYFVVPKSETNLIPEKEGIITINNKICIINNMVENVDELKYLSNVSLRAVTDDFNEKINSGWVFHSQESLDEFIEKHSLINIPQLDAEECYSVVVLYTEYSTYSTYGMNLNVVTENTIDLELYYSDAREEGASCLWIFCIEKSYFSDLTIEDYKFNLNVECFKEAESLGN